MPVFETWFAIGQTMVVECLNTCLRDNWDISPVKVCRSSMGIREWNNKATTFSNRRKERNKDIWTILSLV